MHFLLKIIAAQANAHTQENVYSPIFTSRNLPHDAILAMLMQIAKWD